MRNRIRMIIILLFAIILVVIVPLLMLVLLSWQEVSSYIAQTLTEANSRFIEICISYFSLATSLLLGVVVYFQSQRINDLEIVQHSSFLRIVDVDYSADLGDCIYVPIKKTGFVISHYFTTESKRILSSIDFTRGRQARTIVLPLVFITKNQPLITSIHFKSVKVTLKAAGKEIDQRTFKSDCEPIYALLCNESRILFDFGMMIPDSWEIDEITIRFFLELQDQSGVAKIVEPSATVQRNGDGGGYCLIASQTFGCT